MVQAFISCTLWRQRHADLCEFLTSLVGRSAVSYRLARAIERDPDPKRVGRGMEEGKQSQRDRDRREGRRGEGGGRRVEEQKERKKNNTSSLEHCPFLPPGSLLRLNSNADGDSRLLLQVSLNKT